MLQPTKEISQELVPQAIINRPVASLVAGRGELVRGVDDFDSYEGASFVLDGVLPFAIRRYRGFPEDTSTIYLDKSITDVERITTIVSRIIREFRLSEDALGWQRRDNPEL
jgi:hypothetical protein